MSSRLIIKYFPWQFPIFYFVRPKFRWKNIALIIETLTDNKNRSASSIRTVLQKNGGRLGETGSTAHMFLNCGIIHVEKNKINEVEVLEIASFLSKSWESAGKC